MGRIGFESGSDEPRSSAPSGSYGALMNGLGDLVDEISVASVCIASAQADELRRIERARIWAVDAASKLPGGDSRRSREELAERSFAAQLAAALHVSEGAARNRIWLARSLVNDLPLTLELLGDGPISTRHAQILVDQVGMLDPESLTMLEQRVLPRGMQQTPPQFERSVRTMSERLNPESMVERQGRRRRSAQFTSSRCGMAWVDCASRRRSCNWSPPPTESPILQSPCRPTASYAP
jgi:hypothetical protein